MYSGYGEVKFTSLLHLKRTEPTVISELGTWSVGEELGAAYHEAQPTLQRDTNF